MVKIEKIKIDKWDALVSYVKNSVDGGEYTITYLGKGGAMVSDSDFEKAKAKFIEGMNVGESMMKLKYFDENGVFPQKD